MPEFAKVHPLTAIAARAHSTEQVPIESSDRKQASGAAKALTSATVLTCNSEATIVSVLASLSWCDEVLVFDTGSTDRTVALAARFPNVIIRRCESVFRGFGAWRREAVALARNDWILSVDSDEIVTEELAQEIGKLNLNPERVYSIPFHNYFNGRHIKSCGWYPDRHVRLFNRNFTTFTECHVYEKVATNSLRIQKLKNPIRHYSYGSLSDFLAKGQKYSSLFAKQFAGKRKSNPLMATVRATWCFMRGYLMQRGIYYGYEGFAICTASAFTTFWKYMKLYEANSRRR